MKRRFLYDFKVMDRKSGKLEDFIAGFKTIEAAWIWFLRNERFWKKRRFKLYFGRSNG